VLGSGIVGKLNVIAGNGPHHAIIGEFQRDEARSLRNEPIRSPSLLISEIPEL
jgi:hypothetical protein